MDSKRIIDTLIIYSNGNICCFDDKGEQMGDLQAIGWIELLFDELEKRGVDILSIKTIETIVNGGRRYVVPSKDEQGQWRVKFVAY
jgi:hypothetical protein